jgi:hypothetical protein
MDADLDDLERTGRLLSGRGFTITLSSSLLDPATVSCLFPDLIVVDPFMDPIPPDPDDGVRPAPWLASLHQVPVMCCSAARAVHELAQSGIVTLSKPIPPVEMLSAIDSLLASRLRQARPDLLTAYVEYGAIDGRA